MACLCGYPDLPGQCPGSDYCPMHGENEAPVEHIESIIIAECDCCGAERALTRCWLGNMETFACDECRSASDHD